MEIFSEIKPLKARLSELRIQGKSIGFVPTMGALHPGHISLIERSANENDVTVCSIFVNPTQFNNPNDLLKYPRTPEIDLNLLQSNQCDIVFLPENEEMYPKDKEFTKYHFGDLENVMEGKFRPGHFKGVAVVVNRFFEIVQPHKAYFGLKDFQQLAIVKDLVKQTQSKIEIIECPIIRESDGLAMSSRNVGLSVDQRQAAPFIYNTLLQAKTKASLMTVEELKDWVVSQINQNALMKIEYFEVVSPITLLPVDDKNKHEGAIGCIALWMDDIRLIDNIILFL
ncbi:MAG: pantoate--beta-alanine ligase [Bacteroidota bacterium]